jgi:hypothetical protein
VEPARSGKIASISLRGVPRASGTTDRRDDALSFSTCRKGPEHAAS